MNNAVATDFLEAGTGQTIILIHSSVAGARQWRSLMEVLSDRYHLIAVNLFGYGKTETWPGARPQTLEDQARLIEPFLPAHGETISIVGHSFGGSVAMKAAALFKGCVERLVLIEPNPFYLLQQHGRHEAFQEAVRLRDTIKANGKIDEWDKAAEVFADYWTGDGSWEAMPDERKIKFKQNLKPNLHEWDGVMNERTSIAAWGQLLPKETTVISAADTVRSIDEIISVMKENAKEWNFKNIESGGHMAAVTKPDLVNPLVEQVLK